MVNLIINKTIWINLVFDLQTKLIDLYQPGHLIVAKKSLVVEPANQLNEPLKTNLVKFEMVEEPVDQ